MRSLMLCSIVALCGCAARGPAPAPRVCGVCLAHSWQDQGRRGYGSAAGRRSLDRLQALGIRQLSLTSFGYMPTLRHTTIAWSPAHPAGESFARIRQVAADARARGMTLLLKPHLWIGDGGWRGEIAPDPRQGGWDAWQRSYEAFILAHAALAQQLRAEWFVIGLELKSSTRARPDWWRGLVRKVRARYKGRVTYAANWDAVEGLALWDLLDAVGVQMFAPLVKGRGAPSAAKVEAEAARWLDRYLVVARKHRLPLMLTEAGFVNYGGALRVPYAWPEHLKQRRPTATGDRLQRLGYQALIKTFGRSPEVLMIYWWKWFSDLNTAEEGPVGFSPLGKPALTPLRRACQ